MSDKEQSHSSESFEEESSGWTESGESPYPPDETTMEYSDGVPRELLDDSDEPLMWDNMVDSTSGSLPPLDASSHQIDHWADSSQEDLTPPEQRRKQRESSSSSSGSKHASSYAFPSTYVPLKLLGRGGFGEVWEAVQSSLGRSVAIKFPRDYLYDLPQAHDSEMSTATRLATTFRQEALTMANLEHPNIVPVHDLTVDEEGRPLLTMKSVRGKSWYELIWKDDKMPIEDFLARHLPILIDVSQAVAFAHSRGVVHRDLKPRQVLVGQFGEVLLTDWGLAMVYDEELARKELPHLMSTGLAPTADMAPNPAGTPGYMAPEQFEKTTANIGPQTDIYLLGGLLYYLLTLSSPFGKKGKTPQSSSAERGPLIPPMVRRPNRQIPQELADLCIKAMAEKPKDRISSAELFIEHIRDFISGANRRREASELAKESTEQLENPSLSYEELEDCLRQLDKIHSLWPLHAGLPELRRKALTLYARSALENGDLVLARLQTARLSTSEEKTELLATISALEARQSAHRKQRRQLIVSTAALLAIVLVGGSAAVFYNASQRAKEAQRASEDARKLSEEATARVREAEFRTYSANLKLVQATLDERKFDEAITALQSLPESMRGWEWGYLMRRCQPELLTLGEQNDVVLRSEFAPNSMQAATATLGGKLILWDAVTGEEIHRFVGHSEAINDIDFDSKGERIVSGSEDGKAIIFDTHTGNVLTTMTGHEDSVMDVEFDPSGERVLTASIDGSARIWNSHTGEELVRITGHSGPVWCGTFNLDGTRVVTGAQDGTARMWYARTGEQLSVMRGHRQVGRVQFSPDGAHLLTASEDDNSARIWMAPEGVQMTADLSHFQGITSASFNHDGSMAATASWDGTVKLWHAETSFEFFALSGHTGKISRVRFSPDNSFLLTASFDGTAKLWSIPNGREVATLVGHQGQLLDADFSPDGSRIITASADRTAKIWRVPATDEYMRLEGHIAMVSSAVYSPDDTKILTASRDRSIRLWETDGGETLVRYLGHEAPVCRASFNPDGSRIVSASYDQTLKIWETATGHCLQTIRGHKREATWAEYSQDGSKIISASWDGTARIWDAETGEELCTFEDKNHPLLVARLSPDGRIGASAGNGNGVKVWNAETGEEFLRVAANEKLFQALAFSPDGKFLTGASDNWQAHIWEVDTGRTVASLVGHTAPITGICYDQTGKRIVTAARDGSMRVWSSETGTELMRVDAHRVGLTSVAFSHNGQQLVTASEDMTAKVWHPVPWDLERLPGDDSMEWENRFALWQKEESLNWEKTSEKRGKMNEYWRLRYLAQLNTPRTVQSILQTMDEIEGMYSILKLSDPEKAALHEQISSTRRELTFVDENSDMPQLLAPLLEKIEYLKIKELAPTTAQWRRSAPPEMLPKPFLPYLEGATGPIDAQEQITPLGERTVRIICLVQEPRDGRHLFISGNLEELGNWTPNSIPMTYLGQTDQGTLWDFRVKNVPMQYKFTYGELGQDWKETEEWPQEPNRVLPNANSLIYQDKDGNLVWVTEFGKPPGTE